jgi:hypothetical protein
MKGFDRHFWLAVLVAGAIIVPRSVLVCRAQSEGFDDEYHLSRGLDFWYRALEPARLNDPPLGEGISALPLLVTGCSVPSDGHVLYNQRLSTQTLLVLVGIWKSLLFLPLVGGVFWWLRKTYGLVAAWGGAVLLAVEPNFAAFIPNAGLDVLAAEGIFFACLLAWRYFEEPNVPRVAAMTIATAFAMLLKHTAVVVPILIALYAIVWSIRERPRWRRALGHTALAVVIFLASLWALLLFDVSRPKAPKDLAVLNDFERSLIEHRLPCGTYIGSIIMARVHVDRGHPAFLLGQRSLHGWWYYFPVVATYKVPFGVMVLSIAAWASIALLPLKWDEWMPALALLGSSAFFMKSGISIGFRHFLPAYLFLLILSTRCLALTGIGWRVIGWTFIAATALHGAWQHPNYIAYTNFPRRHIWLKISDSNLEWGQSLKQVGEWISAHPELNAKKIYVAHYLAERGPHAAQYLPETTHVLRSENPMPKTGILIISPTWMISAYQAGDFYSKLRMRTPVDVIAGSMLVYDLRLPVIHPSPKKHRRPRPASGQVSATLPAPAP